MTTVTKHVSRYCLTVCFMLDAVIVLGRGLQEAVHSTPIRQTDRVQEDVRDRYYLKRNDKTISQNGQSKPLAKIPDRKKKPSASIDWESAYSEGHRLPSHLKQDTKQVSGKLDSHKAFDTVAQEKLPSLAPNRVFQSIGSLQRLLVDSYFKGSVDYFRAVPDIYRREGLGGLVRGECLLDLLDLRSAVTARDTDVLGVLSSQGRMYSKSGVYQTCQSTHKLHLFNPETLSSRSANYSGFSVQFCLAQFQTVDHIGLCIPQSCNYADMNYVLIRGFPMSYSRSLVCGKHLLLQKDHKYRIMVCAVVLVLLINLASTVWLELPSRPWISRYLQLGWPGSRSSCLTLCHMIHNNQSEESNEKTTADIVVNNRANRDLPTTPLSVRLLRCFHVTNNLRTLLSVDVQRNTIQYVPAVRVISMNMVVFFHTVYYYNDRNIYNRNDYSAFFSSGGGIAVVKSNVCVEAFFVVSAMLATIQALSAVDSVKSPMRYICSTYLKRLWRLAPVYYFVVLSQTYLFPYWSDTPLYGHTQQSRCMTSLPSHLSFTFNLHIATIGLEPIHCVPQAWYLGADTQLFLLVPWLALLYRRSRRGGVLAITSLPVVCFLLVSLLAYYKSVNTWNATWMMYSLPEHINSYTSGVLLGLVYHRRYLRPCRRVLFCLAMVFSLCLYLVHTSTDGKVASAASLRDVLLFTCWRSCYGVMVAICIYLCLVYPQSVTAELLSSPVWLPLSRLSYSVFLVSCVLQRVVYVQDADWPVIWHPLHLLFDTCAFVTISVILSCAVWVFVEKPADNLSKIFWEKRNS